MEQTELLTLIAKCREGDPEAQERLVVETQNKVYYHCKKFLKNEEDAQDATQDVLITMITSLDKLREPAAFWGWLNGITANRCKHLLTQGTKEWQIPEDEEGNSMLDNMETLDDQTVPDKVIDNAETQRLILDIIDGLPAEQRMTVTFFYYDEMSVKAIAQAMEVSEGTVKSRLNYARKSIKDGVEKLAKKGTKLYGISPLPFLAYFLRMGAQSQVLSPSAAAALTQGTLAATGTTAATATAATAGAGTATAAAAGTKAAGVVGTKIAAAVLAGTLTVGGIGTVAYMATHQGPEPTPELAPVVAVVTPTYSPTETPTPTVEPTAEVTPEPTEEPTPTPEPSEEATPETTPTPEPSPSEKPYNLKFVEEPFSYLYWNGDNLCSDIKVVNEGETEVYNIVFPYYKISGDVLPRDETQPVPTIAHIPNTVPLEGLVVPPHSEATYTITFAPEHIVDRELADRFIRSGTHTYLSSKDMYNVTCDYREVGPTH